jgi:hypothetical protein
MYLSLTHIEESADFGFFLAKESTRVKQRNRLECSDLNPKPSPDFKGIDSIPLSSSGSEDIV